MVTMKFIPVRIDEKPRMKMPTTTAMTLLVEADVLNGV